MKANPATRFSNALKRLVLALLAAAVCLPLTIILTIALLPLWRWIEARYGIEAVGHSGPSDWCFWLIFGAMLPIVLAMLFGRRPQQANRPLS